MAGWLASQWFTLLQAAGVAGSLLFAGFAVLKDAKVRRTEVSLSVAAAHREIWTRMIRQPSLARVLDPEADPANEPPTVAEREFVQLVVVHLGAVRQAVREGSYRATPGMDEDVRGFLALPVPNVVARESLRYQPDDFRRYLEERLG